VIDELTWTEIAELLSDAHSYWIHTTGQTGTPNATPVWGVVAQGVLYHYTESRTLKARNLVHNPRVVVHLESASDVVIVHGDLEHLGHPGGHPEVMRAFERKYHRAEEVPFLPSANAAFDVLYALQPRWALTWCLPDTEASTRRWSRGSQNASTD
jgi:nitroimidazol reductase NimA-like FMN-containing flavoprotein (pyridoxamine 5'-phosphate oxidase superfamily)